MSSAPMIEIQNLTKTFRDTTALQGISLKVKKGELFGLVGPDGAGKTTTLRILAGLLDISSGSSTVNGFDLSSRPETIKSRIGYMAQEFSLYRKLSVTENLIFFAELYDVPARVRGQRMERLLDFAGLQSFKNRRAMHLSGGMQKKLALACTLIHEPPLLLLDEPTTGVDPVSRREFWDILAELHLQGTTILITTPYMDEADRCSRVGLMYQGEVIINERPDRIRDMIPGELIKITPDDWQTARKIAPTLPGVLEVQTYGESLHLLVDSSRKRIKDVKRGFQKESINLIDIRPAPIRMEEAFISLIRDMEEKD